MSEKFDVYAIGNALVDTEIEVSDAFLEQMGIQKGVMTLVDRDRQLAVIEALREHAEPHKQASGGSAANTIIATRYFGGRTYYTCKVANDETGDVYIRDLLAAGVSTNMMNGQREDGISGTCLVMVTPDAERTMNSFLGISETVSADEIDEQALLASRYAYMEGYLVTSPSGREAAIRMRDIARANGVRTAMTFSDPAMVQFFAEGLREMLGEGVDLLFCNQDEAMGFTGADRPEEAINELRRYAGSVVMTRGANGAWAHDGETLHQIDAHPVKAVDSNGAGDMFAGAFLYALTQGKSYDLAGKLASAASARVVSDFGPRLSAEAHMTIRKQILGY